MASTEKTSRADESAKMGRAHSSAAGGGAWRSIPSGIWALGFVSLFMDISSEMIHALLPVYLVTVMGASGVMVGLIEGIAEAVAAITKVFSGVLSDWLGRRKLLAAIGYGLAACTKPVFPLAASIGWLFAARFMDRIGKGIRGAPRDALIADLAPPALRGACFGLRQSLDTVGAFMGPLAAILLMFLSGGDFQLVFWVAVIPAFLSVAVIILAVKDPGQPKGQRSRTNPLKRSELRRLGAPYWWVVGLAAIFTLARFSEAFLVLRAQSAGLPLVLVPAVLVIMSLVFSLSAFPVGVFSDRFERSLLLMPGLGFLVLGDLILAYAPHWGWVGLGVVFWGLHMGFTQGVLTTLVAEAAPEELRGTAFGLFNLVIGVSLLMVSLIAGALWDLMGPQAVFLAGAAFALATLMGTVGLRSRLRLRPTEM